MDIEEFVNVEWTMRCNAEQWATVTAVLRDWTEEHEDDPEAAEHIKILKSTYWTRTR